MGLAQGELLKEQIAKFMTGTFDYLLSQVDLPGVILPPDLAELLLLKGMDAVLDQYAAFTDPFTPQSNFDEMKGLADGSGVDFDTIHRLNLFPEISKASCSFFGAWGDATVGGKTFQLRALDYITDAPSFTDNPLVIVYHPSEAGAKAHASVAWPGTVGILTGFTEAKLGISEIGVSFADDSFGQGTDTTPPEKVKGQPWMSVLKDVAQQSSSVGEALEIIEGADRTCNLIIGVGDGEAGKAYGVEYSGYVAVPYNDTTLLPQNDTWHPQIDSVVYNGERRAALPLARGKRLESTERSSGVRRLRAALTCATNLPPPPRKAWTGTARPTRRLSGRSSRSTTARSTKTWSYTTSFPRYRRVTCTWPSRISLT